MAARLGLRHNTQMPSTTHTRSLLLSMFTTVALTPVERVGSGIRWDRWGRKGSRCRAMPMHALREGPDQPNRKTLQPGHAAVPRRVQRGKVRLQGSLCGKNGKRPSRPVNFGIVIACHLAAKRVSVQQSRLPWQPDEFRCSDCGRLEPKFPVLAVRASKRWSSTDLSVVFTTEYAGKPGARRGRWSADCTETRFAANAPAKTAPKHVFLPPGAPALH